MGTVAEALQRSRHGCGKQLVASERGLNIADQFFHALVADRHAEVAARDIFQFVSLVKNHCARFRENARVRSVFRRLLDGEIGEEEMMVHDDDVALHGSPVHFGDEASFECAAFLAETGIGAGVQLVPEGAGFRQGGQFGPVAGMRGLLPGRNGSIMFNLF